MSNETKWTKGEWVFIDGDRNVYSAGGDVCMKPKVSGSVASKNWSSNARLIAAAPNLYDALEGLMRELPSATTHPAIQNARTALEKAKGREMSQRAETPSGEELAANLQRFHDWRQPVTIKQAMKILKPLASTPAHQEALDVLFALAIERDEVLLQSEAEYCRNEKLNRQLDAALALIREIKK